MMKCGEVVYEVQALCSCEGLRHSCGYTMETGVYVGVLLEIKMLLMLNNDGYWHFL